VEVPLIPRKVLFGPAARGASILSPGGMHLAWTEGPSIRIASVSSLDSPKTVSLPPTGGFRWHPVRDELLVASAASLVRCKTDGTQIPVPVPTGTQITLLAVADRGADRAVIQLQAKDEASGLYSVDLVEGAARRIKGAEGYSGLIFDSSLEVRGGTRMTLEGLTGLYRRDAKGEWHEISKLNYIEAMTAGLVSASADGKTLYAAMRNGRDKAALWAADTDTGKLRMLAEDTSAEFARGAGMIDPATGKPQMVLSILERTRRTFLDKSYEADFDEIAKQLPGDAGFVGRSRDDQTWLLRIFDGGPLRYALWDRKTQKATVLYSEYPALEGFKLATRRGHVVPTPDGLKLPVHVYLPAGSDSDGDGFPDKPLPTVLYNHGGPWIQNLWNNWLVNRNFQLLANRGYAVINAEFRGAGGLGAKFMDAGDREWGGKMMRDNITVADWAVEKGIAIKEKRAMWGWSYGGYSTLAALTFSPDTFAAGLAMYFPGDLTAMLKTPFANNTWWKARVGDVSTEEGMKQVAAQDPARHLHRIKVPVYLTHGALDNRVSHTNTESVAKALKALGKDVVYTLYPDEGHDYLRPASWESFWVYGEHLLERTLGGRSEPPKDEFARAKLNMVVRSPWLDNLRDTSK